MTSIETTLELWASSSLGRGRWEADAPREVVRDHVVGHLAGDDAVPVIDETGSLGQGKAPCGVGRR